MTDNDSPTSNVRSRLASVISGLHALRMQLRSRRAVDELGVYEAVDTALDTLNEALYTKIPDSAVDHAMALLRDCNETSMRKDFPCEIAAAYAAIELAPNADGWNEAVKEIRGDAYRRISLREKAKAAEKKAKVEKALEAVTPDPAATQPDPSRPDYATRMATFEAMISGAAPEVAPPSPVAVAPLPAPIPPGKKVPPGHFPEPPEGCVRWDGTRVSITVRGVTWALFTYGPLTFREIAQRLHPKATWQSAQFACQATQRDLSASKTHRIGADGLKRYLLALEGDRWVKHLGVHGNADADRLLERLRALRRGSAVSRLFDLAAQLVVSPTDPVFLAACDRAGSRVGGLLTWPDDI